MINFAMNFNTGKKTRVFSGKKKNYGTGPVYVILQYEMSSLIAREGEFHRLNHISHYVVLTFHFLLYKNLPFRKLSHSYCTVEFEKGNLISV